MIMKVIFLKKIILGIIALLIIILINKKEEFVIIPSESIRIRVIANSNSIEDLYNKKNVKNDLETYLYNVLEDTKSLEEARDVIKENMDNLSQILIKNNISNYKINYGMNYFPKKTYKGVLYPSGNYESIEVSLGSGVGNNYWCVLFPPLCLINENETTSDVEYKLYVKEILEN